MDSPLGSVPRWLLRGVLQSRPCSRRTRLLVQEYLSEVSTRLLLALIFLSDRCPRISRVRLVVEPLRRVLVQLRSLRVLQLRGHARALVGRYSLLRLPSGGRRRLVSDRLRRLVRHFEVFHPAPDRCSTGRLPACLAQAPCHDHRVSWPRHPRVVGPVSEGASRGAPPCVRQRLLRLQSSVRPSGSVVEVPVAAIATAVAQARAAVASDDRVLSTGYISHISGAPPHRPARLSSSETPGLRNSCPHLRVDVGSSRGR